MKFFETWWRAVRHVNPAVWLVVAAFLAYNGNLRSISSADTNPTRYLPISILTEFDLDLDEFDFLLTYPRLGPEAGTRDPYYVQRVGGHYLSTYPVMPAILSTPVYALLVWAGLADGPDTRMGLTRTEVLGTFLSKVSASLFVALSVGCVYLTLLRFVTQRGALAIAIPSPTQYDYPAHEGQEQKGIIDKQSTTRTHE